MRARNAFTLPELLIVLSIASIALALAMPSFLHAIDLLSVRAARETLLAAAFRTRTLALARGGAELVIDENGTATIHAAGARVDSMNLTQRYRVSIQLENSARSRSSVRYDLLGVGRLAGLTVRLQRRSAEAGISFSAYGRPRVW